jgi:hypothetical protein
MPTDCLLPAYFAPEVAIPVVSALAGVVGFLMAIGRAPFRMVSKGFRRLTGGGKDAAKAPDQESVQPSQAP